MKRFEIINWLNEPSDDQNKKIIQETTIEYFKGSTLNFLNALKKEPDTLFGFIKHLILKNHQT